MEEATRQFWQRTLGMDTEAMRDTASPDDSRRFQRQYPASLRTTIRNLSRLCEQVISDGQGNMDVQNVVCLC